MHAATVVRLVLVIWLCAASALAQDVARMEQVVQDALAKKTFMGSVLVARDQTVLLNKGYGFANVEWEIPNAPSTKFRLGSITKQFTAVSVLLLEERGQLKTDERIKTYLPSIPTSWDRVTVRNLLNHTGGIPNFTALPEYREMQVAPASLEKIIGMVRERPVDFEAGERMSYSNSGYILLGAIIEKVTGGSYEDFVQKNLFQPLGMKDSGYDSNTAIIAHRAAGYTSGPNGLANAGYIHMSVPHAAGALYSTTEDLLRWEQALFAGKVLTPASFTKLTTPFKNNYAYGLTVQTVNGRKQIAHNGGIDGFNTHMAYFPDTHVTVIVLANVNGQAPAEIGGKLAALANGDPIVQPSERKEISVPVATLEAYVGTYEFAPGANLMITLETDHLNAQISGQGVLPIYAERESGFFWKAVNAQVEFAKDASGAVTSATLHQDGRDVPARRISGTVTQVTAITLPLDRLKTFIGVYEMGQGRTLTIALDGDHLTGQMTGQPAFPIFAQSTTTFFFKIVDATLAFEMDSTTGQAKAVTLHQGSITLRGARKNRD